MQKWLLPVVGILFLHLCVSAQQSTPPPTQQKKPLDHSVYDGWQNIGERLLSPDGKWIVYTVDVQEGDGTLVITGKDTAYQLRIDRGYDAAISADSRYLVCKIKPFYKDIRQARIKKKKPEDSPKDSLGIVSLGKATVVRVPRVKSYQLPEKAGDGLAYQLEAPLESKIKSPVKDSAARKSDAGAESLATDAADDEPSDNKKPQGTDLILRDLDSGTEQRWAGVGEYQWAKQGNLLAFGVIGTKKDSLYRGYFCLWSPGRLDTVLKGGHDFRKIAIDESGKQVAFLTERDSAREALTHFYQLWYYKESTDSARPLIARSAPGMRIGWTVSENGDVSFSKSGRRILFGTAPIMPPRDTTIAETEVAKLDIWTYKDDYLQPMQLKEKDKEMKRSYLAVYDLSGQTFFQLANEQLPVVEPSAQGDGDMFLGETDFGKRIPLQWEGKTRKDVYAVAPATGKATLVKKDLDGTVSVSPEGRYLLWYDLKAKQYFTYSIASGIRNVSASVPRPLYDELNDIPDDPESYGVMGWLKGDSAVWVYDRYDIWALDPAGRSRAIDKTGGAGRRMRDQFRYVSLDKEERAVNPSAPLWLRVFNDSTKQSGFAVMSDANTLPRQVVKGPFSANRLMKAKEASVFLFTRETYEQSPNLWAGTDPGNALRMTSINPQQGQFNWGTAHLVDWKTFTGKKSQGILYMPEDFDPTKKYPMIVYFYERLSDGLYSYIPPAPTPSRLNISFFVSRGYLVFTPDIAYLTGHPGKSAYDYVVSGVRSLMKRPYVDAGNLAIQGQSWGGYQVAYLITATHLFKAAWAGAPVADMFSAYGGIRWETGLNRQFQYEHTQSRIGATIWQKPELYVENSPLFHLPSVTTPLVIMANDNDGAVPWYQGIELFTALKRLNKKVWMLTYNGEAHNLVERRNRKDISIREQQYFDWMLKGVRPARWLIEGVPATAKGRSWGLELE